VNKRLRYHLIFWISYISWDTLQETTANTLSSMEGAALLNILKTALLVSVLSAPLKVSLFYLIYFFALRPVLKKTIPVPAAILLSLLFSIPVLFLQRLLTYYWLIRKIYGIDNSRIYVFNISSLVVTLSDILVPVLLLMVIELYFYSRKAKEKEALLAKEKIASELKFLKSQINPHFLFNSLSTIHALAQPKAPDAADLVVQLSRLMRFMLYESNKPKIPINKEIKMIEDYVELQESRYSEKLKLVFAKSVDNPEQLISPVILFPFVENAFKHGAGESRFLSFITIDLTLKSGILNFDISNSQEPRSGTEQSKGIGLTNVKRQLELLYPDHDLKITDTPDSYTVQLSLNIGSNEKTDLPDSRR